MKNMSLEWQKMHKMCVGTHFAGRLASMLLMILDKINEIPLPILLIR